MVLWYLPTSPRTLTFGLLDTSCVRLPTSELRFAGSSGKGAPLRPQGSLSFKNILRWRNCIFRATFLTKIIFATFQIIDSVLAITTWFEVDSWPRVFLVLPGSHRPYFAANVVVPFLGSHVGTTNICVKGLQENRQKHQGGPKVRKQIVQPKLAGEKDPLKPKTQCFLLFFIVCSRLSCLLKSFNAATSPSTKHII